MKANEGYDEQKIDSKEMAESTDQPQIGTDLNLNEKLEPKKWKDDWDTKFGLFSETMHFDEAVQKQMFIYFYLDRVLG